MKEIDSQVGWGPFERDETGIRQREIYICTFAMLSRLVTSDGEISKKELLLIDHLMRESLKLNDERRTFVTKVFNLARKCPTCFEEYARRYKLALKKKPQMYEWLIDVLIRISVADHILDESEIVHLKLACGIFGISEERLGEMIGRYPLRNQEFKNQSSKNLASYKVLGVSTEVDFNNLRKRYEELLTSFDVERLIEYGFSNELVDLAQKRQAEITAAFLEVRKDYE